MEILIKKTSELDSMTEKDVKKHNLDKKYKLAKKKLSILKLQLLNCHNRLFLYLEPQSDSKYIFNRFALVDLDNIRENIIEDMAIGFSGNLSIAYNFDGSKIFSIIKKKEEYGIGFFKVSLSSDKKRFVKKTHYIFIEEFEKYDDIPEAMCFLSNLDFLFAAFSSGDLVAFDTSITNRKNIPEHLELFGVHSNNFCKLDQKNSTDYIVDMIYSWDQKYLLCKTLLSKIQVLQVEKHQVTFVRKFCNNFSINNLSLTSNGRYLLIAGVYFDSLQRVDLSTIDSNTFGKDCFDYLKKLRAMASKEGVSNADKEEKLVDKAICYKFGSRRKYVDDLVAIFEREIKVETEKDKSKFEKKMKYLRINQNQF